MKQSQLNFNVEGSFSCARIGWVGQAQYDLLVRLAQSFFFRLYLHKILIGGNKRAARTPSRHWRSMSQSWVFLVGERTLDLPQA